ncbi:hypothetical protein D0469_20085 [Peribacillus saganii]|uniref:Uncharacterized protein n=1 Tax=Peribacillus saganii TaxID=2303992 RepID=A0A372LBD8_9BACI|nr:hypothetical protein [Peribacillus saganii]RFU63149.1 hypothetical protein D0469_20085 [Peribacillus saganii]
MIIAIDAVNPRFLFLSCTLEANLDNTIKLVDKFNRSLPGLQIGLEGPAFTVLKEERVLRYQDLWVGRTKREWDQWIGRLLKQ